MCARKVSSVSGDARRALQICRYAIHLIQSSTDPSKLISVDVVLKAVRELSSSPALLSLMNASVHQMLFLVCIIKQTRKTGISDVVLVDVIIEHMRVCKTQGVVSPTPMELFDIASELGEYKWILVESNKGMDRSKKLRLNMMEEDVMMVLHKSIEPELQNLL